MTRRAAIPLHEEHDGADTVKRFAAKNAISRAQAYIEIASGRLIARKVGTRTIITREDAARWRRALPKAPVKHASPDRRATSSGLPVWLSDTPETLRPSRHRATAATAKQEKRYRKRRPSTAATP